ncbi:MAG TPA: 5-formyltetrahydrofolate cyclo-ligase [Candidatus Saccharimonadales bacterium]
MDKHALREQLKAIRSGLDNDFVQEASQMIAKKCLDIFSSHTIRQAHVYQTNPKWHEVDSAPLVEILKLAYPECEIEYPMIHSAANFPDREFDLIIVPTLGFDGDRYRIGLGAGWYDRFLQMQPNAFKLGVAYEAGFVEHVPRETHDIQLDVVVTEERVIT